MLRLNFRMSTDGCCGEINSWKLKILNEFKNYSWQLAAGFSYNVDESFFLIFFPLVVIQALIHVYTNWNLFIFKWNIRFYV